MRKWLIIALSLGWLAWELIAAFDGSPHTWPLTQVIVTYLPFWVYMPAALLLAVWLPIHLWSNRRGAHRRPSLLPVGGSTMPKYAKYAKAITAALAAGLASYATAVQDGAVTRGEWVAVAIAGVGALAVVWAVPNKSDVAAGS